MKSEFSKRLRKLLRELAAIAHEREARRELAPRAELFSRRREADSVETWDLIHEMDRLRRGPLHRLEQRYWSNNIVHMNVSCAIVAGILHDDEVPDEVRKALAKSIEFYETGLASKSISMDEED